ncbi:MAG: hypothetical protein PHY45_01055 [Rhodocyclaceae bacterium]|nr:hypothetical protein [Rhodocyclaceae bacterium]
MTIQQDSSKGSLSRAQELFRSTKAEYKDLIRDFLKEERDVMHLKRRSDIHQRLFDHIKRVIK